MTTDTTPGHCPLCAEILEPTDTASPLCGACVRTVVTDSPIGAFLRDRGANLVRALAVAAERAEEFADNDERWNLTICAREEREAAAETRADQAQLESILTTLET